MSSARSPSLKNFRFSSAYSMRSCLAASLPSISMASRRAYFRSSETPCACLKELSSSTSSRHCPPSAKAKASLPISTEVALRTASSLLERISLQSNRKRRRWANLARSISSHCSGCVSKTQRGESFSLKTPFANMSDHGFLPNSLAFAGSSPCVLPVCSKLTRISSGSVPGSAMAVRLLSLSLSSSLSLIPPTLLASSIHKSGRWFIVLISPVIRRGSPHASDIWRCLSQGSPNMGSSDAVSSLSAFSHSSLSRFP